MPGCIANASEDAANDQQRVTQRIGAEKNPGKRDVDKHSELLHELGHPFAIPGGPFEFPA